MMTTAETHEEFPQREWPPFASRKQAAEFFDAHSVAPYLDTMDEITDVVAVQLEPRLRKGSAAAGTHARIRRERRRAALEALLALDAPVAEWDQMEKEITREVMG